MEEKEEYTIETFNLYKIIFIKSKKNYTIYIKNFKDFNKLRLKSPRMFVPFGIELYNHNNIINLEFFDYNKSNEMHNFYSYLQQIDKFFINMRYEGFVKHFEYEQSKDISNIIKNKSYIPCIRARGDNYNPLLRVYIKAKKNNIITAFYKGSDIVNPNKIKNEFGNFTIELGFLWVANDQYGLTWYLNGGNLV